MVKVQANNLKVRWYYWKVSCNSLQKFKGLCPPAAGQQEIFCPSKSGHQPNTYYHHKTVGVRGDSGSVLLLSSVDHDLLVVISFTHNLAVILTQDRLWVLFIPLISPVVITAVRAKMGVIIWNYKNVDLLHPKSQKSRLTPILDLILYRS